VIFYAVKSTIFKWRYMCSMFYLDEKCVQCFIWIARTWFYSIYSLLNNIYVWLVKPIFIILLEFFNC